MAFKKFFLLLAGIPAFLFLTLWGALWVVPEMEYMDEEYPSWKQQKDTLLRDGETREVIFLGDSVMKAAVLPEYIGADTYNLALGGCTPIEMYYSLTAYLEHHPKPRAVFLGLNPAHFEKAECYYTRTLYFHYLPPEMEAEVEAGFIDRDGIDGDEKRKLQQERILCDLRVPSKYAGAILHGKFRRGKRNHKEYDAVAAVRGNMQYGVERVAVDVMPWALQESFNPSPTLDFYFQKILAVCEEREIPITVISLPMNRTTYPVLKKKNLLKDYYEYVETTARRYGAKADIEVDFYEDTYFRDPAHLGQNGAELFSRRFKEKFYDTLPQ